MKLATIRAIAGALADADVRYIVVGGVAVLAHGVVGRLTFDIDIVLQLVPDNIERAFCALGALGFKPRIPVTADQFADAQTRAHWQNERNMQVLNLFSDRFPDTTIDIFVAEPFDFDDEFRKALVEEFAPGCPIRFLRREKLIAMKEVAGRSQDLLDATRLRETPGDEPAE